MSRKSILFNAPDADVTFQSSDGVLICVHRVNLQTHTEGFPPAEIATQEEVCPLSESSSTLEVLFQFIYLRRHPTPDNMPFAKVAALTEAAEKYQVYSAMNICHLRMKAFLPSHAPEILTYAARHDYPTVVAEVAPILIDMPLVNIATLLPPHILLPWVCTTPKLLTNNQYAYIDQIPRGMGEDCKSRRTHFEERTYHRLHLPMFQIAHLCGHSISRSSRFAISKRCSLNQCVKIICLTG
ncbi:hypothetical protein B0H13DRAFT_1715765 [Mycena leptocephala]|nr:hypothetical protein B0H13DRAFT_1715765 [Mycena leptocephala]